MFELVIYRTPSVNLELSNVVTLRGHSPLSHLKMKEMPKMPLRNFKEKNFVALE